ncbi:hypothetical protein GE21DRAFT_3939 [Neurospora crassa]|nr:hypothetical protein GE21DRAFT_3939 [Neurospora crassa]
MPAISSADNEEEEEEWINRQLTKKEYWEVAINIYTFVYGATYSLPPRAQSSPALHLHPALDRVYGLLRYYPDPDPGLYYTNVPYRAAPLPGGRRYTPVLDAI